MPACGSIRFSGTGLSIDGNPEDNLCLKAYRMLLNDFQQLPSVQLHLHKNIPMGAGLGGGSSDGAFTLLALNKQFNLGIEKEKLAEYAAKLGSDCAFFIWNEPCFATGRGEIMEPFALDLRGMHLVLVHPGIHVSTREAFAGVNPRQPWLSVKEILQQPFETWKNLLVNDFEASVFSLHPVLKEIKDKLYQQGAFYASMTGSGSSLYGFFSRQPDITSLSASYSTQVFNL